MSVEARKEVQEFRDITEHVIRLQVDKCARDGHSWPDYDKEAKAGGLTFAHVKKHDGRSSAFGLGSENLWGVHTERLVDMTAQRRGFLAVVSTIEEPNALFRRWAFDAPMQFSVDTERRIEGQDELEAVVRWVRSPHLEAEVLGRLAILEADERDSVDAEFQRLNHSAEELQKDLNALAENRRQAAAEAHNIYLR